MILGRGRGCLSCIHLVPFADRVDRVCTVPGRSRCVCNHLYETCFVDCLGTRQSLCLFLSDSMFSGPRM
jgi:hypothetical protein